jgi:hypothetical protein
VDGNTVGTNFKVNTYTTSAQSELKIAVFGNDKFMITWNSNGQDGSNHGVYAQRYLTNGTADGSEFKINDYTTGDQSYGDIAAFDNNQGYAVAYQSVGGAVNDADGYSIISKRFDISNVALAVGTDMNGTPTSTNFKEAITDSGTIDFSTHVSD